MYNWAANFIMLNIRHASLVIHENFILRSNRSRPIMKAIQQNQTLLACFRGCKDSHDEIYKAS